MSVGDKQFDCFCGWTYPYEELSGVDFETTMKAIANHLTHHIEELKLDQKRLEDTILTHLGLK